MADYPSSIFSPASLTDGIDNVLAAHQNEPNAEIVAIETELGTNPKTITDGTAPAASPASVAQYLDMVATALKTIMGSANWYNTAAAIMKAIGTTKGDIIVFTGSGVPVRQAVGTNQQFLAADSSQTNGIVWRHHDLHAGALFGLVLSNNGTDPTNDIDITTGECRDVADTADMTLASALTKRLDAAWAVGTNQGGLDTGSIANTTYHVFIIKRSDTGVVDALFSTSASAPTMPANYDTKRRIGSIVRTGGAIKAFVQDGDKFMWTTPVNDVEAVNPGTSAVTRTLTVPTGIRVESIIGVHGVGTNAPGAPGSIYISDLSLNDIAPLNNTGFTIHVGTAALVTGGQGYVFTNTSAQVRSRVQSSTADTTLRINTHGWIDTRGRLA